MFSIDIPVRFDGSYRRQDAHAVMPLVGICAGSWLTGIPTATVADLNDEYIERMEDVLEDYERLY